jgi:2-oxoglutarate dehydrogenase E2 component (dihydrolipoamide succinyltransferase)
MPRLYRAEGTVDCWFKQVGDYVHVGDLLMEVSNDGLCRTEIRSPISGFLRQVVIPPQVTVSVGTELGVIEVAPEAESAARNHQHDAENDLSPEAVDQSRRGVGPGSSSPWRYTGGTSSLTMWPVGETVFEGTVVRWLKQVGEYVHVDEPVVEIGSDKVDMELLAPASGVLSQIIVEEEESVPARTVLGVIEHAIEEKLQPIPDVTATLPLFTLRAPAWVADAARPTILRWMKPVGSRIALHESLLEITTDYFDFPVECPVAGYLHTILAAEDNAVDTSTELALIDISRSIPRD